MKKKCIHENCSIQPIFNLPTETKGIYCTNHKKEDMIDVINKKCIHDDCYKKPNYNLPTELFNLDFQ